VTAKALAVSGVEAGYAPGRPVVRGLDFVVPGGKTVAVIGPNGGGKTTLFRAILDEVPHRSGTIDVHGSVAYVPQTAQARLDFPVNALDVVLMGTYAAVPWYRRVGRSEHDRARHALERVGLGDRAKRSFGELSGGQRQRVLVARALVRDARVILLDEPLSGVDHPSAQTILAILDELRDEGRAILISSHDIEQARRFDLVLCINGEQVAFGKPEEALSTGVLQRTYGTELIVLDGEREAVVVQHHTH